MESTTLYVGIDVSKGDLDAAITVDGKKIIASKKVRNTVYGYEQIEQWTRKNQQKHHCAEIHFCIEATGIYSEALVEYLQEKGIKVSLPNPAQVKSFGRTILLRTKTDKVDAGLLAMYGACVKPEIAIALPKEVRELRTLTRHLQYLISRRAEERGHLESAANGTVAGSLEEMIRHYDEQIDKIKRLISDHLDRHPGLRKDIELLKTIPGIGETTAQMLLCELHGEGGTKQRTPKAQVAHAGLAPGQRQSGKSVHGNPGICKTGNSRLRACMYMPTIVAIKHNPVIMAFYHRLLGNGKPKMVALVASMRKLLVMAIGVLNNQIAFDPEWTTHGGTKIKTA